MTIFGDVKKQKQNKFIVMSNYQTAKAQLLEVAKEVKANHKTDKPLCRMVINDFCDSLCKDFNFSERQRDNLSTYAGKLHPRG